MRLHSEIKKEIIWLSQSCEKITMKSLKLTVINLIAGKNSYNTLIFKKQLMKQYTQYLISI